MIVISFKLPDQAECRKMIDALTQEQIGITYRISGNNVFLLGINDVAVYNFKQRFPEIDYKIDSRSFMDVFGTLLERPA